MQFKQLAATLVAAFPLVAAAQSSVVIYGIADASFGSESNGVARTTVVGSGNQSTSRLGFRGTEDLGGGLKALFNLEAGYAMDTGANDAALFGRRAVVGLSGAFGQVTVGREYSPVASIAQWSDALGQGMFGTNLGAFGSGKLTRRVSNSVNYRSNALWGGLHVMGVYAPGERGTGASNDLTGGGFEYIGGPLSFGVAYQTYERVLSGDDKESIVGFGFKEGKVEVRVNRMVADLTGPGGEFKENNLGVTYTEGSHKFFGNIKQNRLGAGKARGYTLAYTYTMSKRTNLYASWARLNNNAAGNFVLASAGNTITPGAVGRDPSAFTMGVRHAF